MFGGLGELAGLMKQARQMQSKMKEMQDSLVGLSFEADSGAGAVAATVNGHKELVRIRISPETIAGGDVELIEDLVRSAVCAAQKKANEGIKQEMQKMTGGLNLPGLDGLLGGAQQ